MAELTRDYDSLQAAYRGLLAKKQESQISTNLERRQIGEQFKIVDPARLPEKPSSPDRPKLYFLAVAGSLLVGLMFAGAREYMDRSLRSEEDVRLVLNLMVLATIPTISTSRAAVRQRLNASAPGISGMVVCVAAVARELLR